MSKLWVLLLSLCCSGHMVEAVQVVNVEASTTPFAETTHVFQGWMEEYKEYVEEQQDIVQDGKVKMIKQFEKDTKCECLGWEDAFKSYGANCDKMGPLICKDILKKLPNTYANHTRCISNYPGGFLEQWCFVSSECTYGLPNMWSTNPFEGAKYKQCSINEGQYRFATVPYKQLKHLAKKQGIDEVTLAMWSYPPYAMPTWFMSQLGLFYDDWEEQFDDWSGDRK